MTELYRCIGCGFEKEEEKTCNCPECGYKMLPLPYERKNALIQEIRDFVIGNEITYIRNNDLEYVGKAKDDVRFPDFNKIQGYVCTSKRTEMFFDRFNQSVNNIQSHIHTAFEKKYEVKLDSLAARKEQYEENLADILKSLGIEENISTTEFPKITLDYHEAPKMDLLEKADELVECLLSLSAKLKKFIAVNNIYGDSFKGKFNTFKFSKDTADLDILKKEILTCTNVVEKKYVVDIFDDGTAETKEMAKTLWSGVWTLMKLPLLEKQYYYQFDDGSVQTGDEYKAKLLDIISKGYTSINSAVMNESFLIDKTEKDLFELYNIMIEKDIFGVMKIDKGGLIKIGESEKQLNKLIGLKSIKDSVQKIKAYAKQNKDDEGLNLHMCFYGNPGTGKTEVARIIAGILHENKILPTDKVIETDRAGMIGQYVGETPQKVMNKVNQAMGGVLFIDEAYALVSDAGRSHFDYGHEAVATLIKAMEDYRGKFCVILAGYKHPMEKMLQTNPGFISRIQFTLDFPNYSRDELGQITDLMLKNRKYTLADNAKDKILDITDVKRKDENFANAREIRNILDQVIMCQNLRATGDDKEIGIVDVNHYIKDSGINLPTDTDNKNHILTAEEELENLVGLESVKKVMKKIRAFAKRNAGQPDFNLHMCFYGNPGTGKTEVARILSRILFEAGVLKEAKLVETDAFGLIGEALGATGPKTKEKISDALGGVLFIDEAYTLSNSTSSAGTSAYGAEAISVLLKEMEDKRGQFCTILAGYKNEMNKMLSTNPGFESRIQFTVDFPDYTREELGEIAKVMLHKKKYSINEDALSRILDITDYERQRPNYANARNVRNILDQVILNQNLRTEDSTVQDNEIILEDVEDYISEKGLIISKTENETETSFDFDVSKLKDDYYEFEEEIDTDYITQAVISISSSTSQGTGFIISKEGVCLTCAHCIEGNGSSQKARISMLLANGKIFNTYTTFKLIKKDEKNDLAVIKLDEDMEYTYLPLLSASYKYQPLKGFIMAGYPFGGESYQNISFTEGKVASVNQIEDRKTVFADMFGKPGNSGSPVIDSTKMKVIGVFWGGITQPGTSEMIPCITPLDEIWNLLNEIYN